MPKLKDEKKIKFFRWLDFPKTERIPATYDALAHELGVVRQTLMNWEKFYYPKWRKDGNLDIEDLSVDKQIELFDKILFKLSIDPHSPAKVKELFARRYGLLLDKSLQVNIDITADDYARIRNEARKQVQEFSRDREVCPEPPLLPDDVREG